MTRIFSLLAVADCLFLFISYALGITSKWQNGVHDPSTSIYWYHFLSGLSTALLTLLVHCLIFTYFLGTGRWVKEVTLAYRLPDDPWHKETRELKRRVFPPALFAMLAVIATGAAGAAAQVGVSLWQVHFSLGTLALAVNLWAFASEIRCLRANIVVLDEILAAVDRVRAARGLPSNAEALLQEAGDASQR
jgi:hypothetical protein